MNLNDIDTYGTIAFDNECCQGPGPFGSLLPRYPITSPSDPKPFGSWPLSEKGEYLYFVQFWQAGRCPLPWSGRVKIGRTFSPATRWKSILGIADGLVLPLGFARSSGRFEKDVHRIFRAYRSHGEWFRPSQELGWLALASDGQFLAANTTIDDIKLWWEQSGRRWQDPCPHYYGLHAAIHGRNLWG